MTDAFEPKTILYDDEMLDKLDAGAKAVHDAVGRTMGPSGQLVMYEENIENPYPTVTKDGVSVASMIALKDQAENMGAQFVIQAARKQVYETGDGTTLTSLLTYKIFKEGRKMMKAGFSPNDMIAGIRAAITDTVKDIENQSIDNLDLETLKKIARVSTNNDAELADKVAEAVHKTGKYGMVVQERSKSDKHEVEYQKGYQLDAGIMAREFANLDGKILSLLKPYVLVTDQSIVDATRLTPILEKICKTLKEGEKPVLIIIAPQVGGDVLQVMKRNITDPDGEVFMAHIRPSKDLMPEKNRMIMEDLAAITGGMFISQDSGYQIDQLELAQLGTCESITSNPSKTLIMGTSSKTVKHINILTAQKGITADEYTKELIDESLAKLSGGVATIKVGGKNITEQTEVLFRVDDAVKACKSAQESGYVRGGGVSMLLAKKRLDKNKNLNVGYKIVMESLKYPAETILKNANREDWQGIIAAITTLHMYGYDINSGDVKTDMLDLNIIDPTKVIVYALRNAASSAISMLRTSVMIIARGDD